MNNVNKTLYIPLYGKAYVSKRGILLDDKKAEEIWAAEGFELKGKSKTKWLAFYMGIRSAVFDDWLKEKMSENKYVTVIHLGCGMDSRVLRVGTQGHLWYDVDFADVIAERRRYYSETEEYKMISGDARETKWLEGITGGSAIVVMEGISMYLTPEETKQLTKNLCAHFDSVSLLIDCYTELAARMSKYKNPINDVGVTQVYGIDDPNVFTDESFSFVKEHEMTPEGYINQLAGMERVIFKKLYAGKMSKKLYKMYEYKKI